MAAGICGPPRHGRRIHARHPVLSCRGSKPQIFDSAVNENLTNDLKDRLARTLDELDFCQAQYDLYGDKVSLQNILTQQLLAEQIVGEMSRAAIPAS